MKKRIFILLLLAGIVAAAFYGKRWYTDSLNREAEGILKIYGTVDIRDASLAFREQERLAEVLVEEGDRVAAGQILAHLTSDRLKASIAETKARIGAQQEIVNRLKTGSRPQEIAQARAEVEAARVKVANALQVRARLGKTSGTGATSQQDLDDAESRLLVEQAQLKIREKTLDLVLEGPRLEDIATAEHQLEALRAELKVLTVRLADMTLTAPAAGIVQSRILEPGEMAGPTHPVVTLALSDPKWIRAYLPEPDLGRIHQGMKARVISDSFPDTAVEGQVGYISPIAEFTPRTVQTEDLRTKLVYETRIMVRDSGDRLRLGMPVTVVLDETMATGNRSDSAGSAKPAAADGAKPQP